jgi:hypothetical protein
MFKKFHSFTDFWILCGKPKCISDLKNNLQSEISINRKELSIAIIDDEPFFYSEILRRHDFTIREIGDPNDIKAVEAYEIVLCDIKGVGQHFNSKFEGGHVIKEIRKKYPSKVIVAYTSQQWDASYNQFFEIADFTVQKDISSDEWVDLLDGCIKRHRDPIQHWARLQKLLVENGISSFQLMMLEDEFVCKSLGLCEEFPSKGLYKELNSDLRSILNSYLANFIFQVTLG